MVGLPGRVPAPRVQPLPVTVAVWVLVEGAPPGRAVVGGVVAPLVVAPPSGDESSPRGGCAGPTPPVRPVDA